MLRKNLRCFFHPDYTVGFGLTPNQLTNLAARGLLPPVMNYTIP